MKKELYRINDSINDSKYVIATQCRLAKHALPDSGNHSPSATWIVTIGLKSLRASAQISDNFGAGTATCASAGMRKIEAMCSSEIRRSSRRVTEPMPARTTFLQACTRMGKEGEGIGIGEGEEGVLVLR